MSARLVSFRVFLFVQNFLSFTWIHASVVVTKMDNGAFVRPKSLLSVKCGSIFMARSSVVQDWQVRRQRCLWLEWMWHATETVREKPQKTPTGTQGRCKFSRLAVRSQQQLLHFHSSAKTYMLEDGHEQLPAWKCQTTRLLKGSEATQSSQKCVRIREFWVSDWN